MNGGEIFWQPFLLSGLLSFCLTRVVVWLAWHSSLIGIDDPQEHDHVKVVHNYSVPRGGGLAVFLAIVTVMLVYLPWDKHLVGILLGATLTLIVGLLDDKFNLSPYWRLAANSAAALIVVGAGIGIAYITNPFNGIIHLDQPRLIINIFGRTREVWLLSSLFGFLWIVWNMNIVGWSSGVDGQLSAFVVVGALVIGLLSLRFVDDITQWPVTILSAAVAGAYLGFWPWNFYPQKIMPGYSGKSLAGFLLAVLSILSGAKVATLILVLGIPMTDAILAISRRISRGQSPVWGDRSHLHHKLLDLGWGKRAISLFYFFTSAILGGSALLFNSQQKFYLIFVVVGLLVVFSFWFRHILQDQRSEVGKEGQRDKGKR